MLLPALKRLVAEFIPAKHVCHRHAQLRLLEHQDDLLDRKALSLRNKPFRDVRRFGEKLTQR
jgi:hypothetical protein